MGEVHINIWRQNADDEGIEVTFKPDHICPLNQKMAYELAFKTKSGVVISFWSTAPENLAVLLAKAYREIAIHTELPEPEQ